jgi:uncharacterized membrane protein YphA (DoxX/SURF4 family)
MPPGKDAGNMASLAIDNASPGPTPRPLRIAAYSAQFFFGGWFLAHGLNYWLGFFPQPHGSSPISHELITALIDSGLFTVVKAVEVLTGIMMLLDLFVPLAIVMAVPVALSIAHLNFVENDDLFSKVTAVIIMALLGLMALGYLDCYRPMLRPRNGGPGSHA